MSRTSQTLMRHRRQPVLLSLLALLVLPLNAVASRTIGKADPPLTVDMRMFEQAVKRLDERQRQRELSRHAATTQPASLSARSDAQPYAPDAVAARKHDMLRHYDARLLSARAALRQHIIPAAEVRRLVTERAALLGLSMDRFAELMRQVDHQNAQRLERYQEAFGDLPAAAKTVSIILMKSGQIDFATPLPEDPLTREVEEWRGVRRVYFQFYLNPPEGSPRRHNGWVEFVYDQGSGLWVPTWTDYNGTAIPLFDAEAFTPLRPYELLFDGKSFIVAQARFVRPPEVFALLTPR